PNRTTILFPYTTLFRSRKEWTDQALDFYILVNAHLTRLARLIGSTSGDPVLIKRCSDLVLQFERATQVPQSEPSVTPKRADRRVDRKSTRLNSSHVSIA